jgi:hypothetical protein
MKSCFGDGSAPLTLFVRAGATEFLNGRNGRKVGSFEGLPVWPRKSKFEFGTGDPGWPTWRSSRARAGSEERGAERIGRDRSGRQDVQLQRFRAGGLGRRAGAAGRPRQPWVWRGTSWPRPVEYVYPERRGRPGRWGLSPSGRCRIPFHQQLVTGSPPADDGSLVVPVLITGTTAGRRAPGALPARSPVRRAPGALPARSPVPARQFWCWSLHYPDDGRSTGC